jgi:hypothetical protein
MTESLAPELDIKQQKKPLHITLPYKILIGIFFAVLLYFANKDYQESPASASQIQYEKWLTETEAKSRASINNEPLPELDLTILPVKAGEPANERMINANNVSNAKEKILRLLALIDEAGLYQYQTDKPLPLPGDIVLKIQSPDKIFHLKFKPADIEKNIKATLTLKLFEEYLKDKIPENMAKRKESSDPASLKNSLFQLFEEQDKKQP